MNYGDGFNFIHLETILDHRSIQVVELARFRTADNVTQRCETEDARYQICCAGEGDLLLFICRSIDCQSYKIIPVNHSSVINHSDKF